MLFGWRKRNEGFEWKEYVRTTILVRRADRQKRLDDARLAALSNLKDAKDRGVDAGLRQVDAVRGGVAAAGKRAGGAIADAAKQGAGAAGHGARALAGALAQRANAIPRPAAPEIFKRSAAEIALYAGDMPRRWRLGKPYLLPTAGVGAAIFVFGSALAPQSPGVSPAQAVSATARAKPADAAAAANASDGLVTGRASAASGETLRVNGKLIRLAGIDAPQPAQPCFKGNGRRWACSASAVSALRKLVRGKRIACELKDTPADGPALAHCRAGDKDIAAAMVRGGHAFASEDLGHLYASEEDLARAEKSGIWQGQSERPREWRSKIWEEAKRSAPDGCPIKGLVRGQGRIYSMPWSAGYSSRTIKPVKGERWFCSEDEARAAGFKESSSL